MTRKILIVDSNLKHAQKIKSILQGEGYSVPAITQTDQGMAQVETSDPDIILVDIDADPRKAYELGGRLRLKADTRDIPVVYLTSHESSPAFPADFIVHDTNLYEMKRKIRHLLIESSQSQAFQEIMKEARVSSEAPPTTGLTGSEASVLSEGGFPLTADVARKPISKRLAAYSQILDKSLSTSEAAERLKVNSSRIRQRLTSRPPTLFGIRDGSEWKLPEFQFDRERLIPNFSRIVERLDPKIDPVALYQWFMAPHVDLVHDDERISPRQWLLSGLPWKRPAELAADL